MENALALGMWTHSCHCEQGMVRILLSPNYNLSVFGCDVKRMTRKNTVFLCGDARVHSSKNETYTHAGQLIGFQFQLQFWLPVIIKKNKIIKVKGLL